jgi:hypothetical protein
MAWFGGVNSAAKSFFNKVQNIFSGQNMSAASGSSSSGASSSPQNSGIGFTISHNIGRGMGAVAGATVYFDADVSDATLNAIGRRGVQLIQEQLAPMKRTGSLEDSWQYRIDRAGGRVTIYSDHPAASSILNGYRNTNIDNLKDWMKSKNEYKGLTDKEKKLVAFRIWKKIKDGRRPEGNSTIASLSATGSRSFDYLTPAAINLQQEIDQILNSISGTRY